MPTEDDKKSQFLLMLGGIDLDTYNFAGSHAYGGEDDVLNAKMLSYILEDIRSHPEFIDKALRDGDYYRKRTDRSDSSIQRTYSIVKDNVSGELSIFIEPKSKDILGINVKKSKGVLGRNVELPNNLPQGADKVLKIAYKVGAKGLEQYAGLVVKFEINHEINHKVKKRESIKHKKNRINTELEISGKFIMVPRGFLPAHSTRDRGTPGEEKRTIYTPYQKDGTLEDLLKNTKTLTKEQEIEIARQILEILVELSNKKVSHHDIKPSNLLVKFDGDNPIIYVTDFGYSLKFGEPETGNITLAYANPFVLSNVFDHNKVTRLLYHNDIANPLKEHPISRYISSADKLASSAHDVYAAGRILFELFFKKNYENGDFDNLNRNNGLELLLKQMLGADSLKVKPHELLNQFNAIYPKPSTKPTIKL